MPPSAISDIFVVLVVAMVAAEMVVVVVVVWARNASDLFNIK